VKPALILLVVFTCGAAASAQTSRGDQDPPVVVTLGEAVVKRAPDRAWVTISAESRAKTPKDAQRMNAEAMTAVMQGLKGAGLPPDAIQTASYDLQPEYDYVDGRQRLRDYVARNSIEVRVDTLQKLGEIIDMSVGSGATRVSSVRFDLQDRTGAEREALRLAVADARERANAAAAGAGVRVERVLRIEEHRPGTPIPPPQPLMTMRAEMAQAPSTPVAPGELEIKATVTLTAVVR
jgi:uncharacterized protein YggE